MSNDWERQETSRAHLHLETVCVSPPSSKRRQRTFKVCRGGWKGWWNLRDSKEPLNRQFLRVSKSRRSPLAILVGMICVFSQERVQMQFPPAQFLDLFPAPRVVKHKGRCKCSRDDDLLNLGKALSLFPIVGHGLIIKRRVIPHMFVFQLLANAVMCVSRAMQHPLPPALPSLVQHRTLLIAMACEINHSGESWVCGFGRSSAVMACEHLPRQITAQLSNSLKQHPAPTQVGSTQIVAVL